MLLLRCSGGADQSYCWDSPCSASSFCPPYSIWLLTLCALQRHAKSCLRSRNLATIRPVWRFLMSPHAFRFCCRRSSSVSKPRGRGWLLGSLCVARTWMARDFWDPYGFWNRQTSCTLPCTLADKKGSRWLSSWTSASTSSLANCLACCKGHAVPDVLLRHAAALATWTWFGLRTSGRWWGRAWISAACSSLALCRGPPSQVLLIDLSLRIDLSKR